MRVVFADYDISTLLTNWFHKKTEESIEEMDQAISAEQQKQTEILQEEIANAIESAEQQLEEFTESEKEKRVKEIETYAAQLKSRTEIDQSELKNEFVRALDNIVQEAIDKMNLVGQNKRHSEPNKKNESEQKDAETLFDEQEVDNNPD